MKVKLIATQQDRENGFSSVNDYNPIDINKFPVVKEEIFGDNSRRISKSLAIRIYTEDLRLPNYILNDIYSSVEQLIRSEYPLLEEYIENFALIASYLNRYSENNSVWSEDFHKQLKKYHEEVANAERLINKLQMAGIKRIVLPYQMINEYEFKDVFISEGYVDYMLDVTKDELYDIVIGYYGEDLTGYMADINPELLSVVFEGDECERICLWIYEYDW